MLPLREQKLSQTHLNNHGLHGSPEAGQGSALGDSATQPSVSALSAAVLASS